MSTCTKWVDQLVIECDNWSEQADYECTTWADEGSQACSQWADEGSNQCSSWGQDCHWYTFWNCIAEWFCKAWYWVANLVCQAWYWVAKWVCKAFAWVVRALCTVFSWVVKLVCVAWDTLKCALQQLLGALRGSRRRSVGPSIKHVFVLMLENRSFDHMLGFSGIVGVDPEGNPTAFNSGFSGTNSNIDPTTNATVNVNSPADFQLKDIDKDPGHEFEDTLTALCGKGAIYNPVPGGYPPIHNSGFIQNYLDSGATAPDRIMKCFTSAQLPVLNALASQFAVCDQWFSSLPGPTWPNRFFLLAATSGGLDGSPSSLDVVSSTTVDGYRFENGNIFDLLDDHCLPWRIIEGDDFPVSFALAGMNLNDLQGRFTGFDEFAALVNSPSLSEKFVFIEPKYGAHEFDVTGPGDFACGNSMHPLDDVTRGELLVKNVYETIRNSPHWEESVLLVTFDEHGGFYDHVAPPAAVPPGDLVDQEYVQHHFQFDQLGVRVPAIVISPFTAKNVIDHTVYDHTSMLLTLEKLFNLPNLTHRDQAANDFLKLISLTSPRTDAPTALPPVAINPNPLTCEEDTETADKLLSKRSALKIAREHLQGRATPAAAIRPTASQIGFLQVALRRVLETAEYPERAVWLQEFQNIQTKLDAALFMTDAKLKLRYAVDMKKAARPDRRERTSRKYWPLGRRR